MEGFVKEPLSRRDLRRRREEKESKKDGGSKDTGRLEAVLTTPSPASYCIDPFPLVLQEAVGVSLPVETLRGEFLSLKRPSVTPGFDKKVCGGPSVAHFCPIGRTKRTEGHANPFKWRRRGPRFREIMEFLSFFCYFLLLLSRSLGPFHRCSMYFDSILDWLRFRLTPVCFLGMMRMIFDTYISI